MIYENELLAGAPWDTKPIKPSELAFPPQGLHLPVPTHLFIVFLGNMSLVLERRYKLESEDVAVAREHEAAICSSESNDLILRNKRQRLQWHASLRDHHERSRYCSQFHC